MLSAFKAVAFRPVIHGNNKVVSAVAMRMMASTAAVTKVPFVGEKPPTREERIEQWDYVNSIFYGPERDTKNFPILKQPDRAEPVRLGVFPVRWFDLLYPKTGVSGPYVFLGGFALWMMSKEIMVIDHYFWEFPSFWIMIYILCKHPKIGPQARKYLEDKMKFEEFKYFTRPINRWKDAANVEIAKNERLIEETETSKHMYLAKKEGIQLQLEAAYRQRLQNAFQEVKKRLDFEVEKVNLKRKYEQEHMVNWIVSSVTKSITPQQEKESIKSCIDSLKGLSAKAAAV
ncbi:ATP synthase subunit b mitochondrial [Biomphalaria pfeifferi]|uniref:ATP synthase subunit b n=1 Tax=Biomphalaria pfeifferi TaxID=112525 RepID=A0AAD8FCV2_BIOPF|nr:ATP synthase subunit b mitochondrial [Biomphalaria pfeifferi]